MDKIKEINLVDLRKHIKFLEDKIETFYEEAYEMELYRKEFTTEYEEVKNNIIIYESELEEKTEALENILSKEE